MLARGAIAAVDKSRRKQSHLAGNSVYMEKQDNEILVRELQSRIVWQP